MPDKDSRLFQFPQVCIAEASAGSGKTYALSKRFIQLLINPTLKPKEIPLQNILAITFSNKATVEMKERILEFLKKIALDCFGDEQEKRQFLSSLEIGDEAARRKAYCVMDYIVRNYNFFQVQTIDSFINAILFGCAFKLNLSAVFKIKRDYSDYLSYSLDNLIDRAAHDRKVFTLLSNFLMQYLHLENRSGWFPKREIVKEINRLFKISNTFTGNLSASDAEFKDLLAKKRKILKNMRSLCENLPEGTHATFEKNFLSFLEENEEFFDVDSVSDYFSREEFPVLKKAKVPAKTQRLWQTIRRGLRELAEVESGFVFNYYIDIFHRVFEDFKALSNKDDVLFLEELNKKAGVLFGEKTVTVPELYYRLATRLRHFLLDEFQDTSLLQWQNLSPMIEEALSCGGSLFYVGDKKQAIYRFRGGEVKLFDSLKGRFRDYNEIHWHLSRNYRSQKRIVEFTNRLFSQENLSRFLLKGDEKDKAGFAPAEAEEILRVFETSQQTHLKGKDCGYVKVEHINSKNRQERNSLIKERLIGLIVSLKDRFKYYKSIALLTRKNDDVELLTEWLLESDIPVESEKTLNIRNNSYIKELVSFLKFLNSPIDDLFFASFILGDIFTKACGIDQRKIHDFIFELRRKRDSEKASYLYREFRRQFPGVWEAFIEEFFRGVGFIPLYELTISIINKFDCLKNFPGYQGFFMKFLELIKEQEEERQDISLFLEFFDNAGDEELYVRVSETDAVRVLTIHKAKGLGFPVVILPFLEMNIKVDTMLPRLQEGAVALWRLNKKYRSFCAKLEDAYRQEYLRAFIDELNSIYVGLTRAQDELYLFVPNSAEKGFNMAAKLVSVEDADIEAGVPQPQEASSSAEDESGASLTLDIPVSQYKDWIHFLKDEMLDVSLVQNRKRRLAGDCIHRALSFIGNLYKQDKERIIRQAVKKAQILFSSAANVKDLEITINRLLELKRFQQFFFVRDASVYQEKEVLDIHGNIKRIDRLIVGRDYIWVIDYKSSKDAGGKDAQQVREYMRILKSIYKKHDIRGVLIYLDTLKMEEVYAEGLHL